MNNTCLKNIKVWYSRKKVAGSTKLLGLDEFEHGDDSEDEELREDTYATAVVQASVTIDPTPHSASGSVVGESSMGFKSPPWNIIIKKKGKKRSHDLPYESILASWG